MSSVKVVKFEPVESLLGKGVIVKLVGVTEPFYFKVMGIQKGFIVTGHDDEGLDLSIDVSDIDYIRG